MPFPEGNIGKTTAHTFADFPVGARVRVVSDFVDHHWFRDDTGTVIRNAGSYLSIIVEFDKPRHYDDWVMTEFNFNPQNLELLPAPPSQEVTN